MSSLSFSALATENKILKDQLNQLKYYLVGSLAFKCSVDDVLPGQIIVCQKDNIHDIAAGLLLPVSSCIDIGPGLRPQRMIEAATHLLVEPHRPYAENIVKRYPEKLVVCSDGVDYLKSALSKSVDTIFILDVIEHLDKERGFLLISEAMRVARLQVVVFTPLGFMPQHFSEIGQSWGDVEHNELQNHLSGWLPSEFNQSISVVCEDYHEGADRRYGAFYSIICCDQPPSPRRLVLISEDCPDFSFRNNDLVIADVAFCEKSWLINSIPKRNLLTIPLQIISESITEPVEILRSAVINFRVFERYLEMFSDIVPIGQSARVVLENLKPSLA